MIFLKSDFFLRLVIKEFLKVDVRTFLLHFFAKNREDGGRVISSEICHKLSQIRGAFLEKNRPCIPQKYPHTKLRPFLKLS